MSFLSRAGRTLLLLAVFGLASHFALEYGTGGLWNGLRAAHAVVDGQAEAPYDLTQLRAVNPTLDLIRKKYVEPERVEPRKMFLGALDQIQKKVAQVIITHEENSRAVRVGVFDEQEEFRVDNVQGHWDVAARLREVFAFLQRHLRGEEVDLPEIEYAAANGMLKTLDPHSVFLDPEQYEEMNVQTSGHFGGLGIVISIRDQMLTVMRPMPGTPAGRAGLERLDRITKINNESTLNMPLEDAVNRLRGEPGSSVTIWIHRDGEDGWSGSRPFELVREEIRVSSVDHETLKGGAGYVRIKQFQATTAKELSQALKDLRSQKSLQALVLDLRDDPGGLLDQAGKVVDTFLEDGVIYATVGASEGRHEQRARESGTQPPYPIVVLVNDNSASASEIVAGALKNQDRAVVLGETTFGKGSVQLVFPEVTPEGAALKLTIAQYLTPGDISIQGSGVTPDIELDPMTVDTLEMDLFKDEGSLKERDLTQTLGAGGRRVQLPPTYTLKFHLPESVRAEIRDRGSSLDDEFKVDAPIRIARDLALAMDPAPRKRQLEQVKRLVRELQNKEMESVAKELAELGIDWSQPPESYERGPDPSQIDVELSTDRKDNTVLAGEPMELTVTVTNNGDVPYYQLYGITKSDTYFYDQRELIFGKVAPGETKSASVPLGTCQVEGRKPGSTKPVPLDAERVCELPVSAVTRQDVVSVRLFAAQAETPEDLEFRPTVESLPRPVFAYSYHVVDNRAANENGQLEKGEGATMFFRVKNIGEGPSLETQANLANLTGDGLLLKAGRFDLSFMEPGEEREVEFTFDILDSLKDGEIKVRLSVSDRDLRVHASEKLELPVVSSRKALKFADLSGSRRVNRKAPIYMEPSVRALLVGHLSEGAVVEALGEHGRFVQVRLEPGRFGFVQSEHLSDSQKKPAKKVSFQPALSHSPPLLEVSAAALATREASIRIEGTARDGSGGVEDAFAFVGSRKVFYAPNKSGADSEMKFSFDAPLKPGMNVITVIARQNEDTATQKTIVVRRDGPNGEALPTTKTELLGGDWEFGEP